MKQIMTGVVVALAGQYANHFHLTPGRQLYHHLITHFFTGQVFFPMPNQ